MSPDIRATYRLQLRPGFGFDEAAAVVPYLAGLGISHVYCSPYLQAAAGSDHGYDVVDHTRVSDDLGGERALARFNAALSEHGMGHILDIVPNHMAISGRANEAWWDVMKNGPESNYARFFDIDWSPPDERLRDKLLVPVLGDQYGRVLESGELELKETGEEVTVTYHDHEFPLAPGSLDQLPGTSTQAETVVRINEDATLMHVLLEAQHYRLAYWKTDLELNYRRFFDINELVALRMEEPEVFAHVHAVPFRLIDEGVLDGLRIDHVDGLRRPRSYIDSLRARLGDRYLVVEKILEPGEDLPDWACDGTTGYDFLGEVTSLFVDPSAEKAIDGTYREFTGDETSYEEHLRAAKLLVMDELLAADLDRLTKALTAVCERHPRHRDYPRSELREALKEVIASLEVYRAYVDPEDAEVSKADLHYVEDACAEARDRRDDIDDDLFEFISALLLLRHEGGPEADFALRFQQASGPVMAKAAEDTAFYRYPRFAALNEVGGDPSAFGLSVDAFHRANETRAERWPGTMLATSTHDTKRSEDVRARLALLSEIPDRWAAAVKRWREMNAPHRDDAVDPGAEYLLYQTLVGAHPLPPERATAYMTKAVREAKLHTSWTAPDEDYESALASFIEQILGNEGFTGDLGDFVEPLVEPGRINSLAMTSLKLTSPGIPDTYQGTELWDLSLVDPDNRRDVDFAARAALLGEPRLHDAAPKLHLIRSVLALRARRPEAFAGSYERIETSSGHLIAFIREGNVATIVPRLVLSRPPGWTEEPVPLTGEWVNVLTGEGHDSTASAGALLGGFPVAVLERPNR